MHLKYHQIKQSVCIIGLDSYDLDVADRNVQLYYNNFVTTQVPTRIIKSHQLRNFC